ncbi:MAG: PEP-CTERM sorting domain-containing protein [Verrucomicrobia bacterium]|nr:PEP-CTERM sorting domain-containing protein [Verrucomicrobiota bacterium]MCH8513332.1 PEP-CTERM sorting domain-containing protein [Kiritimatiellia bacterium]
MKTVSQSTCVASSRACFDPQSGPARRLGGTQWKAGLLSALLCVGVAGQASATLIASFDFEAPDYTTGALDGQQGWTGGATQPQVVSGGHSYASGTVAHDGGSQHVSTNSTTPGRIELPTSVAVGETVYFSTLHRTSSNQFTWFALSDGGNTNFNDSYGFVYSGGFQARARLGSSNTTDSTGVALVTSDYTGHSSGGTTFLFVGKIEYGVAGDGGSVDRLSIQVNPDSTDEPATWQAFVEVASRSEPGALTHLLFRQGDGGTREFDDIRIGSTYDAVVIPEPSTLVLLGVVGVAGLIGFKRRKS